MPQLALLASAARRSGRGATRRAAPALWSRAWSSTAAVGEEAGGKPASDRIHSTDIAFKPNEDGWERPKVLEELREDIWQEGEEEGGGGRGAGARVQNDLQNAPIVQCVRPSPFREG